MPKSYITREQRQQAHFSAWLFGAMKTAHITQEQLAKRLGLSQPGLSQKLKKQNFTYDDLLVIFDVFKPDQKELDALLGIDRHREH